MAEMVILSSGYLLALCLLAVLAIFASLVASSIPVASRQIRTMIKVTTIIIVSIALIAILIRFIVLAE